MFVCTASFDRQTNDKHESQVRWCSGERRGNWDSEKLIALPRLTREERATGTPTTIWLTTYRNKASQLPISFGDTTAVLLSQVEDVEIPLALLSPSVPSLNLSCQDLGKTSQICPPLITPSVSSGIQPKAVVLNQNKIRVKGRAK